MSALDDLFKSIPIDQLAGRLGANPTEVAEAVQSALPALVTGMQANAQDPAGAASLTRAVEQHNPDLVEGGINLDDVDVADGEKIVRHVFGDNTDAVVQRLSGVQQFGGGLVGKLLPMLAPMIMGWLAKSIFGRKQQAPAPVPTQQESDGGLLGGLWDKITGKDGPQAQAPAQRRTEAPTSQLPTSGGSQQADGGFIDDLLDKVRGQDTSAQQQRTRQQQQSPGGIDIGSILGDLLGGGSGKSGGIDIGSVLGGLLGGGRR